MLPQRGLRDCFAGEYIRSSAVVGAVVAADAMMSGGDGQPETLGGVTVTLGGEHAMGESAETDMNGGFAFTGLRAGTYTVTISGFPEDVSFETVSMDIEVEVGDVGQADFTGHFIRTSAVAGQVIIEGEGLQGVTVTLAGGPADESYTAMTDAEGMYSFAELRPGSYTISISDFDSRDYEFASTSQDVSVNLDETGTVSFTGVLLRTSGIAGRVSVEGMGLDSIMVTLSGAADRSSMTDASGQYAFAGLAAGDYTVSIMVESNAYVFESMSMDVAVGDDESAIVNFEGAHARTASVSGMAFIDELMKNDMFDEGEAPLAHAGLPVALVGPGVNEQRIGATDANGQFSFTGLRSGAYQLVVLLDATVGAALAAADLAYGGPGAGYEMNLGVGEAASQAVPFDITHTTINVAVTLKGGDHRGMPIPGATVDFFSDAAGETKIGSGTTEVGEHGVYTSVKVARAGTSDNTVHMAVSADGYFVDPTADMQAVTWNPQSFTHPAPGSDPAAVLNDADIVNLNVDVSVSGATVTTEFGGGDALAGWAISVMAGEDALAGAPEKLDEDGNASFMTAVTPDALPATFTIALAEDQDDELDGGESYEGTTATYVHTGLTLAGTQDAGAIEARYTTQTLMVSVYHEVDQVPGFTGNIGTGDASTTCFAYDDDDECITGVELELRHATSSNRRGTIDPDVWRWDTSGSDRTVWVDKGVYTFRHLPTDHNIFVLADGIGHVEIAHSDNLAAYENRDDNGIMGSAFGPEGGFGHTVSLCPLTSVDPTDQDFGDCGSFGFVLTHTVAAHVKKMIVQKDSDDGFRDERAINVTGVELGFTPVTGKNIAGEADAITTLKDAARSTGEGSGSSTWDDEVDERQDLYFGRMAEGVYGFSLSSDWSAVHDGTPIGKEFRVRDGAVADITDLTGADGPFRPDDEEGIYIEVRPTTGTLYGIVLDEADDPLEEVEVTVNGVTVETDIDGRYIVPDFSRVASRASRTGGKLYVSFSLDGYDTQTDDPNNSRSSRRYQITDADGEKDGIDFEANDPVRLDVVLKESAMLATLTGTVTDKDGEPVSGVDLTVTNEDGKDVLHNRQWLSSIGAYCTVGEGDAAMNCRRTGDDGTYEMLVRVTEDDEDYTITPSKNRYYFDNTDEVERLESGDEEDGVDFEALRQSRIRGAVKDADDADADGVGGVMVTATAQGKDRNGNSVYIGRDETNDNGRFTIWVDGDERYDIAAMKDGYSIDPPKDGDHLGLRVDDNETHDIGTFTATPVTVPPSTDATLSSLTVTPGVLKPDPFDPETMAYTATVGYNVTSTRIAAMATSSAAMVKIAVDDDEEMGTGGASMDVDLEVGDATVTITVDPADDAADEMQYTVVVTRSANKPSAPQNLEATSPSSGALTVTWEPPSNAAGFTGYETKIGNGAWTPNTGTASGGSLEITDGLTNGVPETISVRTVTSEDDGEGGTTVTPGASASITAAPWPAVSTLTFLPASISEGDDPDTDAAEDSTQLTITVDASAFEDFDVMLTVVDEDHAGMVTFPGTATIRRGQTTATVVVEAVDNEKDAGADDLTVQLEATMVPAEAAERPPVEAATGVTITDDDEAPSAPGTVTVARDGTTNNYVVGWAAAQTWGTGSEASRKFQYRFSAAASFTEADGWTDVAADRRAVTVKLTPPEAGGTDITYNIQVRAVTDAGESEPGTASQPVSPPAS